MKDNWTGKTRTSNIDKENIKKQKGLLESSCIRCVFLLVSIGKLESTNLIDIGAYLWCRPFCFQATLYDTNCIFVANHWTTHRMLYTWVRHRFIDFREPKGKRCVGIGTSRLRYTLAGCQHLCGFNRPNSWSALEPNTKRTSLPFVRTLHRWQPFTLSPEPHLFFLLRFCGLSLAESEFRGKQSVEHLLSYISKICNALPNHSIDYTFICSSNQVEQVETKRMNRMEQQRLIFHKWPLLFCCTLMYKLINLNCAWLL